jgi:hypothetical protein
MTGAMHRGHYIRPLPEADKGKWNVLVLVEVHAKGQVEKIHYRDPAHSYASREEAESAGIEFGKQMIENFIVPAYGDGDLKDEAR